MQCTAILPVGSWQWNSCNASPYRLGSVGSGTPVMHCHTAWGVWDVEVLQCTGSPPGGSRRWYSCTALPHYLGVLGSLKAVGSGTPVMHSLSAQGRWAVELLQCTASSLWGSRWWDSCNALPHCSRAVGSGIRPMQCHTAWSQGVVELLRCTPSLPGGSGQCNSQNALPHCSGVGGRATPVMH